MTVFKRVLLVRGLRAFSDGCISLVLPFYLTSLGLSPFQVGTIATATMLGSGAVSLTVGTVEHRYGTRVLLCVAGLLMAATGAGFVLFTDFWPLLLVAFVGTINPSSGDVSIFLPLEHATLAGATEMKQRTSAFARYSLVSSVMAAIGALAAGLPQWLEHAADLSSQEALRSVFIGYGVVGLLSFIIYRGLPRREPVAPGTAATPRAPLTKSRAIVMRLTALFCLDSFSTGFIVQSMMALYLFHAYALPIATAGRIFFWTGLLAATSYPFAVFLTHRIGSIRTMVYTHIPAILALMLIPFMSSLAPVIALLTVRALFGSMDSPVRSAFVMNAVSEDERAAAASFTTVPKSLAAAISPSLSGWMLSVSAFGWPLLVTGVLKFVYIYLLYRMCRDTEPAHARATPEATAPESPRR